MNVPSGLKCKNPRDGYRNYPCYQNKLGTYTGGNVELTLKAEAKPVFLKARRVPFARLKQVQAELKRLEDLGVLTPVNYYSWATPLVVVPKKGAPEELRADSPATDIRLCGDYRSTVNNQLLIDRFPLPTPDQLFTQRALHGFPGLTCVCLTHNYK